MKILIIEDNEQMRKALKSFVMDLAEGVYECSDGAQALNAYAQHRPDWVLMDVEMKDVEGFGATRQIKAHYPQARIMLLTNYDDADLREKARLAGACQYLVKEDLLTLRRILIREEAEKEKEIKQ
jgi:two-component system NarL family response regulator